MVKRILKVVVIVIAVLLILLITLPFAFQGAIVERIKHEVNEQLDARVDFGSYRLSLLRYFPDISLRVDDIVIVNEAPFEGDTLASVGRVVVTIDLRSFFADDGYEIKGIHLASPDIRLRYLADGSANWDIVPFPEEEDGKPEEAGSTEFKLALRRLDIQDGRVLYHDDAFLTYVDAVGLNGRLYGDLSMDITNVSTRDARIESFSLRYDRFPVLSRVGVGLTAKMEMDLRDWIFTFRENELLINALPVSFDGVISLPPGGGTMMDFSFAAARSDFAAFLSLIPTMYADDYAALETAGAMALSGRVNGLLKGEAIPAFSLSLAIDDGMFRYPDLPSAVSNVNVEAHIINEGISTDDVVAYIPTFRMLLAENPVEARLAIRTPVSDPWIDMAIDGRLDLGEVETFIPLPEDMLLSGVLESNLEARGHISALERAEYQLFHAEGGVKATDVIAEAKMLPARLEISQAEALFSPRHLKVSTLQARMGESDLYASGQIDNVVQYFFEGGLLKGRFDVRSDNLDINQLMPDMPEPAEEDEPMELAVIRVPGNIDFQLLAQLQRVAFGTMDIKNLEGTLHIADQQVTMDQLGMDMLGGRLALNGSYDTRDTLPDVSFALDFFSFDMAAAFNTFNTVRLLAPIGEYASGLVSGGLSMNATLDESLQPLLATLTGRGSLRSSAVIIDNNPSLLRLADRLQMEMFTGLDVRDVALRFAFSEGKVETEPFDIRFGRSGAQISGSTWFDRRIDYAMRLDIPYEQFGTQAMRVLDNLVAQAADKGIDADPGERVQLDVHIGGTVTRPSVTLGMPGVIDAVTDRIRDEAERLIRETEERVRDEVDRVRDRAEEEVREQVDEVREEIHEELEARAQQVIEEAERRAASIRREAANAAGRVRQEARKQAERLLEEASGPIATAAARRTGDAIIAEADHRAGQIEEEAVKRAQDIVDEAHRQAERIRQGGE